MGDLVIKIDSSCICSVCSLMVFSVIFESFSSRMPPIPTMATRIIIIVKI